MHNNAFCRRHLGEIVGEPVDFMAALRKVTRGSRRGVRRDRVSDTRVRHGGNRRRSRGALHP